MNEKRLRSDAVTSGHWRRSDGTRELTYLPGKCTEEHMAHISDSWIGMLVSILEN